MRCDRCAVASTVCRSYKGAAWDIGTALDMLRKIAFVSDVQVLRNGNGAMVVACCPGAGRQAIGSLELHAPV